MFITKLRKHLTSPWLWFGALLAFLIFIPNLIWQVQHDFISIDFLSFISGRDKLFGRTDGFFSQQLYVNVNPIVLPLALAGIYFYLSDLGKEYRPLLYIFITTLLLFRVVGGRFYYAAPLYPMLIAGGSVVGEKWIHKRPLSHQKRILAGIGVGYGENQPDAVIAIGFNMETLKEFFNACRLGGKNDNKYQIDKLPSDIYLCEDPKGEWESLWPRLRRFA